MLHSSFKIKSFMLAKNKVLRFHSANFLLAELRSLVIQTHVQTQMWDVCKFGLKGHHILEHPLIISYKHLPW